MQIVLLDLYGSVCVYIFISYLKNDYGNVGFPYF